MISYITGTILSKQKNSITVLTQSGLGYDVQMSTAQAMEQQTGTEVSLYTFLRVTDSAHTLYGFFSAEEKAFFELLLSVSGVGPKSAMNILAIGSIEEISAAIGRKDVKYLTAVQGMGKKTAERLVVELQNKVAAVVLDTSSSVDGHVLSEVIEALVAMGYQKTEAVDTAKQLDTDGKPTEILLREALRLLSNNS